MKKILCLILAALLLCGSTAGVSAADSADVSSGLDESSLLGQLTSTEGYDDIPAATKDDQGHVVSGGYITYFEMDAATRESFDGKIIYRTTTITGLSGDCMYLVYGHDGDAQQLRFNGINSGARSQTQTCEGFPDSVTNDTFELNGNEYTYSLHTPKQQFLYIRTNLPIFDSIDPISVNAYKNNGNLKGALNSKGLDFIDASVSDDETLNMPAVQVKDIGSFSTDAGGNLQVNNVQIGWLSDSDGSVYDIKYRVHFYMYKTDLNVDWASLIGGASAVIGGVTAKDIAGAGGGIAACISAFGNSSDKLDSSGWGDWSSFKTVSAASPSTLYTVVGIPDYINAFVSGKGAGSYFIDQVQIRVRHRVGTSYGLNRDVTIDYTDGSSKGALVDDKGVEHPDPGSGDESGGESGGGSSGGKTDVKVDGANISITVDNSANQENNQENNQTVNQDNNNNNSDQVTNIITGDGDGSGSDGFDWSFATLLAFIKSGFGLLGETGLIALLSSLYGYLPAAIWTILTAAVAGAVTLMLISMIWSIFKR